MRSTTERSNQITERADGVSASLEAEAPSSKKPSSRRLAASRGAGKEGGTPSSQPVRSGRGNVLVVDDQADTRDLLRDGLARRGYVVEVAETADEVLAMLTSRAFDVVVTDMRLDGMSGIELCARVERGWPDVPVMLLTGFGSLDAAVAAMRAGAFDFIQKPVDFDALDLALARAVQHHALRDEVRRLRKAVERATGFDEAIGESPTMRTLFDFVDRISPTDTSVIITGETGTGKEVIARILHGRSARAAGPFVAINCAALPPALLESELFGHERGSFTDAKAKRDGLFVQATGGTVFLDEIGSMPLDLQPKLLRALETRSVRPVGGNHEIPFDVRLIAATNEDLESAVAAGRFREDLYFRINVIHVPLPPLRVRGNDILLLAQHFITRYAKRSGAQVRGLTPSAAERLLSYPWPGNVRELQNCIERAVALTGYEAVTVEDLPDKIRGYEPVGVPVALDANVLVSLAEVERRYILRVLSTLSGNKAEAARVLGVDRKTLYRKLEGYDARPERRTEKGVRGGPSELRTPA